MNQNQQFKKHLIQAFNNFKSMNAVEQTDAAIFASKLLLKMSQTIGSQTNTSNAKDSQVHEKSAQRTDSEKTTSALRRKTNGQGPQKPIKPVKTTNKNELRR